MVSFFDQVYSYRSSDADVRTFWCKKKASNFSRFIMYPHGQGGQFFVILCGRLLWMALYTSLVRFDSNVD